MKTEKVQSVEVRVVLNVERLVLYVLAFVAALLGLL
jgi:hypothetical protein